MRAERVPVQLLSAERQRIIPNGGGEIAHRHKLLTRLEETPHQLLEVKPEMTSSARSDAVVQILCRPFRYACGDLREVI